MTKQKIKLFDFNFKHSDFTTDYQKSNFIEWDRNLQNISSDELIFITDNCIINSSSLNGRKVGLLFEPREINPHIYSYVTNNTVDLEKILTYDKDLLDYSEKFEFYPHGGCWIQPSLQSIYEKSKLLSIIVSNKKQTFGHRLRHDVIGMKDHLKNPIDIFGNGYNPIEHKITALQDYAFTIVIENTKRDFYFTEKLIDSFMTGTVPIYWGCPSIDKFFNLDGMILFDNLYDLQLQLNHLSFDKYNSMIEAINENFQKAKNYLIAEDWIYKNSNIFKQQK